MNTALDRSTSSHFEDMCRDLGRIQFDVIPAALPSVTRIRQQIVNLERLPGAYSKIFQRNVYPTGLRVFGIQIYNHEDNVRTVRARLAVGDQLIVVEWMKAQTPIALQGKIFAANLVYQRDQLFETVGPVKVPHANLIFFGFEIFLAARHQRPVLEQLEGGSIDPVICAQGRR